MSKWQESAACAGHNEPDLWHPVEFSPHDRDFAIRAAKAVCADCPVRLTCLDAALTNGHEGIWGGTTDEERVAMSSRKPVPTYDARCGSYSGYSRHTKRGEQVCAPCRAAGTAYEAQRRAMKREASA